MSPNLSEPSAGVGSVSHGAAGDALDDELAGHVELDRDVKRLAELSEQRFERESGSGQDLLDDLRRNQLLPYSTIFIMVTGERQYERVVSAAELAPNDYILKPFAADTLQGRIERALTKRDAFMPTYRLIELGNAPDAFGQTWHLPCDDERLTYKQFVALAAAAFGRPPDYTVIGGLTMTVAGLFKKEVREIRELLPRYKQDNLFDSTKFKRRFPDFAVTTYREGLRQIREQASTA